MKNWPRTEGVGSKNNMGWTISRGMKNTRRMKVASHYSMLQTPLGTYHVSQILCQISEDLQ